VCTATDRTSLDTVGSQPRITTPTYTLTTAGQSKVSIDIPKHKKAPMSIDHKIERVVLNGKKMCGTCQNQSRKECKVREGVEEVLHQWASNIVGGNMNNLERPLNSSCQGCLQSCGTCSLPVIWELVGRHYTRARFINDDCDVNCLPYNVAWSRKKTEATKHTHYQLEDLTTEPIEVEEERPTKRAKKSEVTKIKVKVATETLAAQPVASSSRPPVIPASSGQTNHSTGSLPETFVLFYSDQLIN